MKNAVKAIMALLLLLALAGCGKNDKEAGKQNNDTSDAAGEVKQAEVTEAASDENAVNVDRLAAAAKPDQNTETESKADEEASQKSEGIMERKELIIEEHIIETDDKTIYGTIYMPKGEGKYPAVILSHGYNGVNSDFIKECRYFAENGYVAYAFDFCGGSTRSKSSGATTDMTLFTEKNDLLTVFENISSLDNVDAEQIFLFGGSQGGMVSALVAAELKEKVAGMILYYPAFCIPDNWRVMYPDLDKVPEVINFWGMNLGKVFARSIHDFNTYDTIGNYSGDVLIIYGEKDPIVSMGDMEKAKEVYNSVELIVLENEAHGFSPSAAKYAMEKALEFMQAHTK